MAPQLFDRHIARMEMQTRPPAPAAVRVFLVQDSQAIADRLRARGLAVPQMSIRGDFAVSGSLRYRNPGIYVDRRLSGLNGIFLGDVRLLSIADEAPADDVRPDGTPRRQVRIESNDDADRLIDELLAARAAQQRERAVPAQQDGQSSASGFTQLP